MTSSEQSPLDRPTSADRARQVAVLIALVLMVAGAAVGSGALGGTPIAEAAGGALGTDATLVSPGGPAFSIWSVIYVGLAALTVWQLLPGRAADPRQRRLGGWVVASMLLNAAWILSIQGDLLALSVPVILLLWAVLVRVLVLLRRTRPDRSGGLVEAVVVDGTLHLYLGWVTAASIANTASLASADGGALATTQGTGLAFLALGVGAALAVGLALLGEGRLAVAAGIGWALVWIAVQRLTGELRSDAVATTAFIVLALVVVVTLVVRGRTARTT